MHPSILNTPLQQFVLLIAAVSKGKRLCALILNPIEKSMKN